LTVTERRRLVFYFKFLPLKNRLVQLARAALAKTVRFRRKHHELTVKPSALGDSPEKYDVTLALFAKFPHKIDGIGQDFYLHHSPVLRRALYDSR
jgi:hypothetical protein